MNKMDNTSSLLAMALPKHNQPTGVEQRGRQHNPKSVCANCVVPMCCVSEGPISLTPVDVLRLCVGLNLTPQQFLDLFAQSDFGPHFTQHTDAGIFTNLRRKTEDENSPCIFLAPAETSDGVKIFTCSAHEFRPWACREFFYDGCSTSVSNELGVILSRGYELISSKDQKFLGLLSLAEKEVGCQVSTDKLLELPNQITTRDVLTKYLVLTLAAMRDNEWCEVYQTPKDPSALSKMLSAPLACSHEGFSFEEPTMLSTDLAEGYAEKHLKFVIGEKLGSAADYRKHLIEKIAAADKAKSVPVLPIFFGTRFELFDEMPNPVKLYITTDHVQFASREFGRLYPTITSSERSRYVEPSFRCAAFILNHGHWLMGIAPTTPDDDLSNVYGEFALMLTSYEATSGWIFSTVAFRKSLKGLCIILLQRYHRWLKKAFEQTSNSGLAALLSGLEFFAHQYVYEQLAILGKKLGIDGKPFPCEYPLDFQAAVQTYKEGDIASAIERLKNDGGRRPFDYDPYTDALYELGLHSQYVALCSHGQRGNKNKYLHQLSRVVQEAVRVCGNEVLSLSRQTLVSFGKRSGQNGGTSNELITVYNLYTHLSYGLSTYNRYRIEDMEHLAKNVVDNLWDRLEPAMRATNTHILDPEVISEFVDAIHFCPTASTPKVLTEEVKKVLDLISAAVQPNGSVNSQSWDVSQRFDNRQSNLPPQQEEYVYLVYHSTWTVLDALRAVMWEANTPAIAVESFSTLLYKSQTVHNITREKTCTA